MHKILIVIFFCLILGGCKKDEQQKSQKFATALIGFWTSDSTTYKSTFSDGRIEKGTYHTDSSSFRFKSNGTFERYFSNGNYVEDNTGNKGGTYVLNDSLVAITVTSTPAVYYDGREYKILTISDHSLTLYRVGFGNSPVTNEAWYKYRK